MRSFFRPAARVGPAALLLAGIAGLLQAASMANPFDGQPLWWLQLTSMTLLAGLLEASDSPKCAARLGWVFATAWLTGTFWWLFISMHTYGGLAAPLAVVAVVGLAAVLSVYYAMVCALFRRFMPASAVLRAMVFASCWLLAELARGVWFTGFPWGAAGYAHLQGLGVFARYVGVYGIGWIASVVACLLAAWLSRPLALRALLPLVLIGAGVWAAHGLKPAESPPGSKLAVTLLQGNIPQDEKFEAGTGVAVALQWYAEQLNAAKTPLVVAPETALPLLPQQMPVGYWDALQQRFHGGAQTALIGVPLGNRRDGYTNAVIGLQPGAPTMYNYAKHHLVPFGEFIPPLFKWFTEMMNIPLGDFNRGAVGQASMAVAGQRLAPNICYEDLFGEELGARFADPSQAPTVFVNVSNIGWFGDSLAIDQHLSISRMRTLEFERPMIRATNTGATAIIDHRGRVVQALPRLTRGVLMAEVEGRGQTAANGWNITPFAWWVSRFGLWPLWALGGLGLLLGMFAKPRTARR